MTNQRYFLKSNSSIWLNAFRNAWHETPSLLANVGVCVGGDRWTLLVESYVCDSIPIDLCFTPVIGCHSRLNHSQWLSSSTCASTRLSHTRTGYLMVQSYSMRSTVGSVKAMLVVFGFIFGQAYNWKSKSGGRMGHKGIDSSLFRKFHRVVLV